MTKYTVYMATSPSDKRYVGYTSRSLKRRIQEHCSQARTGSTKVFHRAICKYNENMTWEILGTFETEKEALDKEIYYIEFYNTRDCDRAGYNSTLGGEGSNGYVPTEEQNKKNSLRQKERMKDPEFRASAIKNLNTGTPWNKGKKTGHYRKADTERKWKESMKKNGTRSGNPNVPIELTNMTTNEVFLFDTMYEACKKLNLHQSAVQRCANGQQKYTQGFTIKKQELRG